MREREIDSTLELIKERFLICQKRAKVLCVCFRKEN